MLKNIDFIIIVFIGWVSGLGVNHSDLIEIFDLS